MPLTVEEFRKKVAEDAKKPKIEQPDPFEDFGPEIDKHPIINPTKLRRARRAATELQTNAKK